MYKIESDLSSRADINELADFVEILCLRDEHVSKQEIIAILGRVDDNERTSGLDADERLESKIDDIFSELEFRFRISNGKYPFDIDESGHVIYVSNTVEKKYHYLYFYLLLSTRLNMKNNKIQNSIDGTLLFEEVAVEIIRDYLGIKSKSFLFGTSANDSNFKSKIEQLCVEMEEGGGFVQRDNDPPSYVKDDKLDIVAWIPFKDKCTGKLIVFGQCKTGTSYKEELVKYWKEYFIQHKCQMRKTHRLWVEKNRTKVKRNKRQWDTDNKEHVREYYKKYIKRNKEKYKLNQREYRKHYTKNRRKKDPKFRLSKNISSAIWFVLKGNKVWKKWERLVGYTINDLIEHLEKQFDDKMNWNNYGKWQIDHIIPKSFFDIKKIKDNEFKKCWTLDNLQPLWEKDNLKKYNKI